MSRFRNQISKAFSFIRNNRIEFVVLILILVTAAFFRLYKISGYMTFLGDEGRDVLVVKRMIVDHKWTLLGPTASVGGFFLGPIYYYFMMPFLWLFRLDPVGPAVMVAFFGIATVFLVYQAGRDFFGPMVGLPAAGLYAVSPLVIAYSRSSWNPNLMPFFSLLIIWVTWKAVVKTKPKLLGTVGFLFGITIQLHYLTLFLMAIIFTYIILFFCRFKYLKYYFLGLFGFVVGWFPFILFELRHRFPNFITLYRFLLRGEETGLVITRLIPIVTDVLSRLFGRLVANNQTLLASILLFLSLIILFTNCFTARRQEKLFKTYFLLCLWLFAGVVLFGFYQKGIYDYYFGFMFPLPFLLTALVLYKIARIGKAALLISGFLALWLFYTNLRGAPFRFQPNHQLRQTKQVAKIVYDKIEGRPFNFALIAGQNSDHAYRYFLEVWGVKPLVIENPQVDPERKTVTDQLLVVCELIDCHPLGHSLWEIAGFGRAEVAGAWQAPAGIRVIKLVHYQGDEQ